MDLVLEMTTTSGEETALYLHHTDSKGVRQMIEEALAIGDTMMIRVKEVKEALGRGSRVLKSEQLCHHLLPKRHPIGDLQCVPLLRLLHQLAMVWEEGREEALVSILQIMLKHSHLASDLLIWRRSGQ